MAGIARIETNPQANSQPTKESCTMTSKSDASIRTALTFLLSALLLISVSGCAPRAPVDYDRDIAVDLLAELQTAAQVLLQDTSRISPHRPVLTSALVNIDNLQQSSTFGRQVAEVFGSEIARTGVPVIELKTRDALFTREGTGELSLSPELRHLSQAHNAQAVLVGTYAIGGNTLYVNARLVQTIDHRIVVSHNFSLPLNRDIRALLSAH